jgi:acetate kinase
MAILAVNAGSSSLKFSLHPRYGEEVGPSVLTGNIQGLEPGGTPEMGWSFNGASHQQALADGAGSSFARALAALRSLLALEPGVPRIAAVAHRVVHGGAEFRTSVIVTDAVLQSLTKLNSLAPLHQPHNLEGMCAPSARPLPELPQMACFDTAFHATLPRWITPLRCPRP